MENLLWDESGKETIFCRTPVSFVAEVGRYVVNEAENWRKNKNGLMVMGVESGTGFYLCFYHTVP